MSVPHSACAAPAQAKTALAAKQALANQRELAREQVFEYIEVYYYNRKCLHSTLGYLSPEAFEARKAA